MQVVPIGDATDGCGSEAEGGQGSWPSPIACYTWDGVPADGGPGGPKKITTDPHPITMTCGLADPTSRNTAGRVLRPSHHLDNSWRGSPRGRGLATCSPVLNQLWDSWPQVGAQKPPCNPQVLQKRKLRLGAGVGDALFPIASCRGLLHLSALLH